MLSFSNTLEIIYKLYDYTRLIVNKLRKNSDSHLVSKHIWRRGDFPWIALTATAA